MTRQGCFRCDVCRRVGLRPSDWVRGLRRLAGVYRIGTASGVVDRIDLGGVTDIGSDGLLLRDGELYSVTRLFHPWGEISDLRLSEDYSRAWVQRRINGRGMDVPSTAAFDGDDPLVVNFQYQIAEPNLPFTVVRVSL